MPMPLEDFERTVTSAIEDIPADVALVVIVDEDSDDGAVVAAFKEDEIDDDLDVQVNAIVLRAVSSAAMATRVRWSPTEFGPSQNSWSVTVVKFDEPARFLVYMRRAKRWFRIGPAEAPWFALATAGGLRNAIADRKPLNLRQITPGKHELLKRPADAPNPPTDKRGLL